MVEKSNGINSDSEVNGSSVETAEMIRQLSLQSLLGTNSQT